VGCVVVNVEYRLAPEHPFPVSIDDGCTVARWVLDHKTVVGKQAHTAGLSTSNSRPLEVRGNAVNAPIPVK